jgi:hypothetical protein
MPIREPNPTWPIDPRNPNHPNHDEGWLEVAKALGRAMADRDYNRMQTEKDQRHENRR